MAFVWIQLDSVNGETLTAVVVNRDNGLHPATIIVDRYNRMGYDNSVTVHRWALLVTLNLKMQDYRAQPFSTLHPAIYLRMHIIISADVHWIFQKCMCSRTFLH